MFGLKNDQIALVVFQCLILPAIWWMLKFAMKELKEAVDSRAEKIVEKHLEVMQDEFTKQFNSHETSDERRFNELTEQIRNLKGTLRA